MIIRQAQVRGESPDGKNTVSEPIKQGGFKPNTWATVVLTGWSFDFKYGDHNILKLGLYLQRWNKEAIGKENEWVWAHGVDVHDDGTVNARYYAFIGSENMDNPFTFLVNYAVIGEAA
jgi:hypothetical protein